MHFIAPTTKAGISIVIIATIFIMLESLALPLPLQPIPDLQSQTAWQVWLGQQKERPRVVMLPFAPTNGVADFEQTTRWMLESRHFQAAMFNGYSGFFPPDHPHLRKAMLAFPSNDGLDLLRELGMDYLVVHHNLSGAPELEDVSQQLALVFRDKQNNVAVYTWSPQR